MHNNLIEIIIYKKKQNMLVFYFSTFLPFTLFSTQTESLRMTEKK